MHKLVWYFSRKKSKSKGGREFVGDCGSSSNGSNEELQIYQDEEKRPQKLGELGRFDSVSDFPIFTEEEEEEICQSLQITRPRGMSVRDVISRTLTDYHGYSAEQLSLYVKNSATNEQKEQEQEQEQAQKQTPEQAVPAQKLLDTSQEDQIRTKQEDENNLVEKVDGNEPTSEALPPVTQNVSEGTVDREATQGSISFSFTPHEEVLRRATVRSRANSREVTPRKDRDLTPRKEKEMTPRKEKEMTPRKERELTTRKDSEDRKMMREEQVSKKDSPHNEPRTRKNTNDKTRKDALEFRHRKEQDKKKEKKEKMKERKKEKREKEKKQKKEKEKEIKEHKETKERETKEKEIKEKEIKEKEIKEHKETKEKEKETKEHNKEHNKEHHKEHKELKHKQGSKELAPVIQLTPQQTVQEPLATSSISNEDADIDIYSTFKINDLPEELNEDEFSTFKVHISSPRTRPLAASSPAFRPPEEWELKILALERGEWVDEMANDNAFRRWKKERKALTGSFFVSSSERTAS